MKLHKAMEHVLRADKKPLAAKEIVIKINALSLYTQGDNQRQLTSIHRLVAFRFTDIMGYTAMMSRNKRSWQFCD